MKAMSKPQQRRYLSYQLDPRDDKNCYYSKTDITLFKRYDKRLATLKTDNHFEFQNTMEQYFEGNYIYNIDTFFAYLLLNYKQTQTTLTTVMNRMNVSRYHRETLESYCLGLQAKYHHKIITASFTHDLEIINILI